MVTFEDFVSFETLRGELSFPVLVWEAFLRGQQPCNEGPGCAAAAPPPWPASAGAHPGRPRTGSRWTPRGGPPSGTRSVPPRGSKKNGVGLMCWPEACLPMACRAWKWTWHHQRLKTLSHSQVLQPIVVVCCWLWHWERKSEVPDKDWVQVLFFAASNWEKLFCPLLRNKISLFALIVELPQIRWCICLLVAFNEKWSRSNPWAIPEQSLETVKWCSCNCSCIAIHGRLCFTFSFWIDIITRGKPSLGNLSWKWNHYISVVLVHPRARGFAQLRRIFPRNWWINISALLGVTFTAWKKLAKKTQKSTKKKHSQYTTLRGQVGIWNNLRQNKQRGGRGLPVSQFHCLCVALLL